MTTAKSLKRLRTASTAFLEDGGSFLHGVDSLLRDIQRTLADLQRREQTLVAREAAMEARESHLSSMLLLLNDRLVGTEPAKPTLQTTPCLQSLTPSSPLDASETVEAELSTALTEIQDEVAAVVTPVLEAKLLTEAEPKIDRVATPLQKSQSGLERPTLATQHRSANQRKKRRR